MSLETGELIAVLLVAVVLLIGTLVICFRCWKAIGKEMDDRVKPPTRTEAITRVFRNSMRRSYRGVQRTAGSIRQSFRSRAGQRAPGAPVRRQQRPQVATISDPSRERSDLHPSFMKKPEPVDAPPSYNEAISTEAKPQAPGAHAQLNAGSLEQTPSWQHQPREPTAPLPDYPAATSGYLQNEAPKPVEVVYTEAGRAAYAPKLPGPPAHPRPHRSYSQPMQEQPHQQHPQHPQRQYSQQPYSRQHYPEQQSGISVDGAHARHQPGPHHPLDPPNLGHTRWGHSSAQPEEDDGGFSAAWSRQEPPSHGHMYHSHQGRGDGRQPTYHPSGYPAGEGYRVDRQNARAGYSMDDPGRPDQRNHGQGRPQQGYHNPAYSPEAGQPVQYPGTQEPQFQYQVRGPGQKDFSPVHRGAPQSQSSRPHRGNEEGVDSYHQGALESVPHMPPAERAGPRPPPRGNSAYYRSQQEGVSFAAPERKHMRSDTYI